jgi:dTDP-4-amino-4,6-dideoxygalactose transaminase
LDTLQAAILLAKFDIFPEEIELRQQAARRYTRLLKQNTEVQAPMVPGEMKSAWAQYSVLAKDETHRSKLQAKLKEADIPTAIYYPKKPIFRRRFITPSLYICKPLLSLWDSKKVISRSARIAPAVFSACPCIPIFRV